MGIVRKSARDMTKNVKSFSASSVSFHTRERSSSIIPHKSTNNTARVPSAPTADDTSHNPSLRSTPAQPQHSHIPPVPPFPCHQPLSNFPRPPATARDNTRSGPRRLGRCCAPTARSRLCGCCCRNRLCKRQFLRSRGRSRRSRWGSRRRWVCGLSGRKGRRRGGTGRGRRWCGVPVIARLERGYSRE